MSRSDIMSTFELTNGGPDAGYIERLSHCFCCRSNIGELHSCNCGRKNRGQAKGDWDVVKRHPNLCGRNIPSVIIPSVPYELY